VRKITDKVFDRLTEDAQKREKEALRFEEVYIAVLCVYKYNSGANPVFFLNTLQFFYLFLTDWLLLLFLLVAVTSTSTCQGRTTIPRPRRSSRP